MEIGSKLKNARKNKGLTQEQAAEALGVSRQTISNWENNKSYPDIISVIKMSDCYSVSLDHLLKEENTMKQSYQEFLEESTNVVKAKRRLEKIILFSAYLIAWTIATVVFWQVKSTVISECNIIFKCILLPVALLVTTIFIGKNNYWGKGNWLSVLLGAITYFAVPYVSLSAADNDMAFSFCFPNFRYMAVGAAVAFCGICIGTVWKNRSRAKAELKS